MLWYKYVYCELLAESASHNQRDVPKHAKSLCCSIKVVSNVNHIEQYSGLLTQLHYFRPVLQGTHVVTFHLHIWIYDVLL